jgi:hypothetical protein
LFWTRPTWIVAQSDKAIVPVKTKITNKVIYVSVTKLASPEFVSWKQVKASMWQLVEWKRETGSEPLVPVIRIVARIEKAVTVSGVIVPAMMTIVATREMTMVVSSSETAVHPAVMWPGLGLNRKDS